MTKFAQSEWPLRGVLSALLLSPFLAGTATMGGTLTLQGGSRLVVGAAGAGLPPYLTAWAATPGNDATAAQAEGAFLLGLDLADYTEDMKIVAVALQGNKFTIDTNVDLTKVRGRLYVLVADSPADIVRSGTKISGTVGDITNLVNIDASAPAKFFKVGIDYEVGN